MGGSDGNLSITVGITTYNRRQYLDKMRTSLYACYGLDRCNIRVYDDCSEEFDAAYLKAAFPGAKEIIRRPINLGAEGNLRLMYQDFLATGDKLLFTADSDLVFNPNWLEFVLQNFRFTDGVLSLFNSAIHHPTQNELVINNSRFDLKSHLGAAGTIIHRDFVQKIVNSIDSCRAFDWAWSAFLTDNNVRLLASHESYVQHIGVHGANCDGFLTIEIADNFKPGNQINSEILVEVYVSTVIQLQKKARKEYKKNRLLHQTLLGRFLVRSSELKKASRKKVKKIKKKLKKFWRRILMKLQSDALG